MNEITAKDRIEFDKCFVCGAELNLVLKNNMSKHSDNWKIIEHSNFGTVKIHIRHIFEPIG